MRHETPHHFLACLLLTVSLSTAAEPVPVAATAVGEVLVEREVRAPAAVVSRNRAVVTSQITALVDEIAVDVGADVSKGARLVKLDAADARLELSRARAELQALEAQIVEASERLRRAEDLLERDFVSKDELTSRRAALAVLEAQRERQRVAIDAARLTLARTEIKAPFDATVVAREGQVGSLATPGTPLLTLVQTAAPEVDAEIDPRYADSLDVAPAIRYVSEGRAWPVSLARLTKVVEPGTRKQRGRFRFDREAAPIGSTGDLVWSAASGLVPVDLVVQRSGELGVFTVEDGRARFVAIPAAQEGRPAAADLPPDALIVTRGQARLQDGDEVQISRD